MKSHPVVTPVRLSALALALLLGGCSSVEGLFSKDKVDYRSATAKPQPLDVPPDLSQLARDNRYGQAGGVVSAAASPNAAAPASASDAVAPIAVGDLHVERDGAQRWLVVPMAPEKLFPIVKTFWQERGFTIASEDAQAGVMETDWAENRAKLPDDLIRSTLGRLVGKLYDTGERDRFRTRIERNANGSEVYISHRGLEEVYADGRKDSTEWRPRATDPQLEAEFLTRLMVRLGASEPVARTTVAQAPETPARARSVGVAALEVDEPFDRAWRRVGLALDRSGFTVEDRDRTAGLYYVRYVDPKSAGTEEPGFFGRLFSRGKDADRNPVRYRIAVKGAGDKSSVAVLSSSGGNDVGEAGPRIVEQLVKELR